MRAIRAYVRFGSKADSCRAATCVRYGPIADMAPGHSITLSARESTDGGTVRPSALAVFRLSTNSFLVGAWRLLSRTQLVMCGRFLHCCRCCAGGGQNNVGRKRYHFRRISVSACGVRRAPANVDLYVAAFGPAQLLQSLQERRGTRLTLRVVFGVAYEQANTPHPLALLRRRSKRPCRRAADKRNELAPPHWLP